MSKSAHTALAVKACLLGGNSNTKCSLTFVNIAVAISALAGGGQKRFRTENQTPKTVSHRDQNSVVFSTFFRGFLGVWAQESIEMEFWVILVAFRQWKNGQKWKKNILDWRYSKKTCKLLYAWLETLQKHCQKQCFGRIYCLYGKKRVNYRLFDWKHWKNTVKHNGLQGFLIYMLDLATGIGTWKNWRKHCK